MIVQNGNHVKSLEYPRRNLGTSTQQSVTSYNWSASQSSPSMTCDWNSIVHGACGSGDGHKEILTSNRGGLILCKRKKMIKQSSGFFLNMIYCKRWKLLCISVPYLCIVGECNVLHRTVVNVASNNTCEQIKIHMYSPVACSHTKCFAFEVEINRWWCHS